MARYRKGRTQTEPIAPLAALLTWMLPGLGHVYVGQKARGIIFMTVIAMTFWGGVAIGGVKSTVLPAERQAWFMAQVCTGVHAAAVMALASHIPDHKPYEHSPYWAYAPAADIAVVYTGVAGLLNVLVVLDVLGRVRNAEGGATRRSPPAKGGS